MRALLISVMDDSGKAAAPLPVGLAYVGAAAERDLADSFGSDGAADSFQRVAHHRVTAR
jgi:hypothetical protein